DPSGGRRRHRDRGEPAPAGRRLLPSHAGQVRDAGERRYPRRGRRPGTRPQGGRAPPIGGQDRPLAAPGPNRPPRGPREARGDRASDHRAPL
ncbi:MAG: hypothetical protein AVDCRST_MAG19-4967, partial [uncultured Thermomicrobiales bacterium]